jgi:hypothetical protein
MKLGITVRYHDADSRMCAFNWLPLPESGEDPWYSFQFYAKNEYVGYVLVFLTKYGFWETHTAITNEDLRGKGLSIKMYDHVLSTMLERGLDVRSADEFKKPGYDGRDLIWNSKRLREKYRIVKIGERYKPYIRNND